jgi:hypothetical protein
MVYGKDFIAASYYQARKNLASVLSNKAQDLFSEAA